MTREIPCHRQDFPALRELQTRWSDNDVYGHINNTVHYQLFDSVLNAWLIENGLLDPRTSDVIGLVVNTGCSYFAELSYPEPITAGLRLDHMGRSSLTYKIALFGDAETAAAQGHFTHVLVSRDTRKPCAIPDKWKIALEALKASPKSASRSFDTESLLGIKPEATPPTEANTGEVQ